MRAALGGLVESWADAPGAAAWLSGAVTSGEDEQFVSFGEQGAQLTYGSYLRLPQLLDAQHLESDPPAHDELLFITIHQVYELWFKQLLHEVGAACGAMFDGHLWWAQHLLTRVHVIERVLVQQVDVLETMTPQDFLEFRQRLAPASACVLSQQCKLSQR